MKINASEIRVGMLLDYKDDLWEVLKTQHVKPGKGGAFAQVEMKSVNKNTKLNERFRSSESVEKAALEETSFNYLYDDAAVCPLTTPSVFSITHSILLGKSIDKGLSSKKEIETSKFSDRSFDFSPKIFDFIEICSNVFGSIK